MSVIINIAAIRLRKRWQRFFWALASFSALSQAADGHAPSLSLANTPKFLAAEWLHYFFKRSRANDAK